MSPDTEKSRFCDLVAQLSYTQVLYVGPVFRQSARESIEVNAHVLSHVKKLPAASGPDLEMLRECYVLWVFEGLKTPYRAFELFS